MLNIKNVQLLGTLTHRDCKLHEVGHTYMSASLTTLDYREMYRVIKVISLSKNNKVSRRTKHNITDENNPFNKSGRNIIVWIREL